MKRGLSFRQRTVCLASGQTIDVLTIFFGRAALDINVVDDALQDALKTDDPLPDAVALVSFGAHTETLIEAWQGSALRAEGLKRRGRTAAVDYLKELSIWSFSDGAFEKRHRSADSRSDFLLDMAMLVRRGLEDLVELHGAFQEAPPGHVFRHPSKRESNQFLLASELLKDEIDAYFVALAVCAVAWPRLRSTRTVHIDTMGIYAVARAMEDIVLSSGPAPHVAWEIDSFHSHGGVSGLYSIVDSTEVVLISASTSGSMAKQLAEAKVPEEAIITILDMSDQDRHGSVVYARDRESKTPAPSNVSSQGTSVIELAGEYFAARGKKPRSVVLTKMHKRGELDTLLANFSHAQACSLNKQRAQDALAVDLVGLDENAVAGNLAFTKWLVEEVRLKTPVSVTHVIFVGGDGAKTVAELAAAQISTCTGRTPLVLAADNVLSLQPDAVKGVLVCAPIVGNGHALRSLARDLREIVPDASRHFVVGIALPSTSDAWNRLSLFLTQSGNKDRPYVLSRWSVLPTGAEPGRGAAWLRADKLMQRAERLYHVPGSPWEKSVVDASLPLVSSALEEAARTFLRTPNNQALKLTNGFVYWTPRPGELDACDAAAASFVSMSSAVQHAREFAQPSLRLSSSIHETVVLDPENFLRFNDGVLQASLLRAALPHELDYSGAPELSEMIREFLEKVFINHERSYGEAALEFAFALASGHLRLSGKDKDLLIDKTSQAVITAGPLLGLLYCWWIDTQPAEEMQRLLSQAQAALLEGVMTEVQPGAQIDAGPAAPTYVAPIDAASTDTTAVPEP
jgi:hypothetical protein